MNQVEVNKRRYLRYPPDPHWDAAIFVDEQRIAALIVNESCRGCQLMVRTLAFDSQQLMCCLVQLGRLHPLDSKICWIETDGDLTRLGIAFLE